MTKISAHMTLCNPSVLTESEIELVLTTATSVNKYQYEDTVLTWDDVPDRPWREGSAVMLSLMLALIIESQSYGSDSDQVSDDYLHVTEESVPDDDQLSTYSYEMVTA
jgi:hypothetical protein